MDDVVDHRVAGVPLRPGEIEHGVGQRLGRRSPGGDRDKATVRDDRLGFRSHEPGKECRGIGLVLRVARHAEPVTGEFDHALGLSVRKGRNEDAHVVAHLVVEFLEVPRTLEGHGRFAGLELGNGIRVREDVGVRVAEGLERRPLGQLGNDARVRPRDLAAVQLLPIGQRQVHHQVAEVVVRVEPGIEGLTTRPVGERQEAGGLELLARREELRPVGREGRDPGLGEHVLVVEPVVVLHVQGHADGALIDREALGAPVDTGELLQGVGRDVRIERLKIALVLEGEEARPHRHHVRTGPGDGGRLEQREVVVGRLADQVDCDVRVLRHVCLDEGFGDLGIRLGPVVVPQGQGDRRRSGRDGHARVRLRCPGRRGGRSPASTRPSREQHGRREHKQLSIQADVSFPTGDPRTGRSMSGACVTGRGHLPAVI